MGRTKSKQVRENMDSMVMPPFGENDEETLQNLRAIDIKLDGLSEEATKIVSSSAFTLNLKLIIWEYLQLEDFARNLGTKAQANAALEEIINRAVPLFDTLKSLDNMTSYIIEEKALTHSRALPDPLDRIIEMQFLSFLLQMLNNLLAHAEAAQKTFPQSITRIKHYPKIRLVNRIAKLLLHFKIKPTLYKNGTLAILVTQALSTARENVGPDQIVNILREARKMTKKEYDEFARIYPLNILLIPSSIEDVVKNLKGKKKI
jgi:hypothetical protein